MSERVRLPIWSRAECLRLSLAVSPFRDFCTLPFWVIGLDQMPSSPIEYQYRDRIRESG